MGGLPQRIGAQRLGDSRRRPLEHRSRCLRRHVPGREAGSSGRQDETGRARELSQGRRDLELLVRDGAVLDVEPFGLEEADQQTAALVVALT